MTIFGCMFFVMGYVVAWRNCANDQFLPTVKNISRTKTCIGIYIVTNSLGLNFMPDSYEECARDIVF